MRNLNYLALMTPTLLIGASSVALAGPGVIEVPEPSSVAVLAVGLGAAAIIKFRKRRRRLGTSRQRDGNLNERHLSHGG